MAKAPYPVGIYEKALPASFSWAERLSAAKEAHYDFIEMSIDESDWRMKRLEWSSEKRSQIRQEIENSGIEITTMCLSAHRRFPLGSQDSTTRVKSLQILANAIDLALDINIKIILVPGYDVFYENSSPETERRFFEGLVQAAEWANQAKIILALENTDKYITSITQAKAVVEKLNSPWFQLYGDIGNLVAAGYDVLAELSAGADFLAGIHIKDAKPGVMRGVPFGEGKVPFKDIFRKLNEIDFQGPLMLELWEDPETNPVQRIQEAREWILEKINSQYAAN